MNRLPSGEMRSSANPLNIKKMKQFSYNQLCFIRKLDLHHNIIQYCVFLFGIQLYVFILFDLHINPIISLDSLDIYSKFICIITNIILCS